MRAEIAGKPGCKPAAAPLLHGKAAAWAPTTALSAATLRNSTLSAPAPRVLCQGLCLAAKVSGGPDGAHGGVCVICIYTADYQNE